MLPAITTTHVIPRTLPSGCTFAEETIVRCRYCLSLLGTTSDLQVRVKLESSHHCSAKRLAKKPSASVPYN